MLIIMKTATRFTLFQQKFLFFFSLKKQEKGRGELDVERERNYATPKEYALDWRESNGRYLLLQTKISSASFNIQFCFIWESI